MRRRPATPRPLLGWIALGLVTVVAGCVTNAGAVPSAPVSTPGATSSTAAVVLPTETPSPVPTLPWSGATPTPSPSASPTPTPTPAPSPTYDPPPKRGRFEMNLYHRGDFATQVTKIYCVPG